MADPSKPGVSFGITGIPAENVEHRTKDIPYAPGMPLRREISKLAKSKEPKDQRQWTLYVLALERFKNLPVDEKLSYFQVAGIHAYPQLTWDEGEPSKKGGFYCTHGQLTFSTWHRVYMLLFEQLVWKHMKAIIQEWKLEEDEDSIWREAADTWRLPYWDWARHQVYAETFALPEVLTMAAVKIFPPESKAELYEEKDAYPNPLYGFDNPEKDGQTGDPLPFGKMPKGKEKYNINDSQEDDDHPVPTKPASDRVLPWSLTNSTGRWAIQIKPGKMYTGLDGVNNFMAANRFFGASVIGRVAPRWVGHNPGNLSEKVNRMMKDYTWGLFASTKWTREHRKDSNNFSSLEAIHNTVHGVTGGNDFDTGVGHMSDVPVAAFDPIFWLHHCQIDRLLAMWQSLNWKRWWDESADKHPVDPSLPGKPAPPRRDITPKEDLKPFHRYDGKPEYWNSDDCRDWTKLGYQYDDLVPHPDAVKDGYLDEEHYKTDLLAYINSTYPGAALAVSKIRGPGIETPEGLSNKKGAPFPDYVINVVYDRYALGGTSYSIKFWLGGPSNEPQTNEVEENYIGEVFTFTGSFSSAGGCENCKRQAEEGVLSFDQVPITIPLLSHIFDKAKDHPIENLTDKEVEEYLKLHLGWTFVQHGGRKLNPEKFPNTEISVMKGQGVPQYTEPEQKLEAELVSIATMSVASLDALPVNPVANLSQATIDEPKSRALPPTYSEYEPIYDATDGKTGGLSRPS
ncbi:Tyrosinase [Fusarium falciforme]|uniref:Tyrosinase n=1 Tax=Fusarium falciforme TaxID=195108 RepID=UPI0023002DE6|nr:Tyrosinase [Fusarium falciforme]WAO84705.1 Tyrosinase [Fusarium falciforme]